MKKPVLRVAVTGPESTGKSELCAGLANHYQTLWVPEYARVYLPELQRAYTVNDIVNIYTEQFRRETEMLQTANGLLFTDTEYIVACVWCENAFGFCPEVIEAGISAAPYDLYLLTQPDLPWEYDPLRENPGKGEFFFEWYQRILTERNLPFEIVSGIGASRLQHAIAFVEKLLMKNNQTE